MTKPKLTATKAMMDSGPVVRFVLTGCDKADPATVALAKSIGWTARLDGDLTVTCSTAAEIDAARNPLRGLVA